MSEPTEPNEPARTIDHEAVEQAISRITEAFREVGERMFTAMNAAFSNLARPLPPIRDALIEYRRQRRAAGYDDDADD